MLLVQSSVLIIAVVLIAGPSQVAIVVHKRKISPGIPKQMTFDLAPVDFKPIDIGVIQDDSSTSTIISISRRKVEIKAPFRIRSSAKEAPWKLAMSSNLVSPNTAASLN